MQSRRSLEQDLQHFSCQYEGVNSFAQAVVQAQQMEKFIKADLRQKKTIKQLQTNLTEFCEDFNHIDKKIQNVVADKD